jgi:hypothetical protein
MTQGNILPCNAGVLLHPLYFAHVQAFLDLAHGHGVNTGSTAFDATMFRFLHRKLTT